MNQVNKESEEEKQVTIEQQSTYVEKYPVTQKEMLKNKGKLHCPAEGTEMEYAPKLMDYLPDEKLHGGLLIQHTDTIEPRALYYGQVSKIKQDKEGKYFIVVRHGDYLSAYVFLDYSYVNKHEWVQKGERIGVVYPITEKAACAVRFSTPDGGITDPASWIDCN